jgi:hypothetical protein
MTAPLQRVLRAFLIRVGQLRAPVRLGRPALGSL